MLAFNLSDIITVPFGYLMSWLYDLTSNYGVALILFAVIVKLVLFPISAKSKKSTMKMSRLTPRVQELQAKYANDPQKQNEAIQALYKEENASMAGGCLWSLIPLLILLPLYAVIRQPITYMLHASADVTNQIMDTMKTAAPELFTGNSYYHQIIAAQHIPEYAQALRDAIPGISESILAGINFNFLGINLGAVPQFNIFSSTWVWNWAHIGAFLIPCLSAGSQVLQMWISQKTNDSVITNEKGIQDAETAKNSQTAQTNQVMMWMMPLMSLWIGFTLPAALGVYWIAQSAFSAIQEAILGKFYNTKLEEQENERQRQIDEDRKRRQEEGRKRQEQQRQQVEQKQTLKEKRKAAQEAKEARAKKPSTTEAGRVGDRPYARGRSYKADRYDTDEK